MILMKNPFKNYRFFFSQKKLLLKMSTSARQAGLKVLYSVLLLFYAFLKKETPLFAKNIIIGVLGYFIAPFDALPDLTPVFGYTDDLGVLTFGLVTLACYIDKGTREKAKSQLRKWFGEYNEAELVEVDNQL